MKENYNQAKICPHHGHTTDINRYGNNVTSFHAYCDLKLEPDLTRIMEKSRNEEELRHVWSEFREKVGPPIRNTFMRYVDLANQAAQRHGFRDAGDQMRAVYEDPDFFFTVQDLWGKVQPLYKNLFTFVRRGLYNRYGDEVMRPDGPIPAHLLGNMWAQNWRNILDIIKPYSETPDVTGEMMKQGYTPLKIFQVAEEFFTSLGLPPMSPEFWRNSIIQKPNDVYTQCAASAWDFCNLIDFRIKQCTQISLEDFINSHHEMTHIHVSCDSITVTVLVEHFVYPFSTTCNTPLNHLSIAKAPTQLFTKPSLMRSD
jgi:peptidyl-dipeptidase A